MPFVQPTLATLARLITSLVRRLWNSGCLGRIFPAILSLMLVSACAAPRTTSQRTAQPTSAPLAAASAPLLVATMPADYTPPPTPADGSALPTWTPAPLLPTGVSTQSSAAAEPTVHPGSSQLVPAGALRAVVVNTIDGDTIDVDIEGTVERVRFIGIDTPETKHPSKGVECYGREASARTAELLDSQTVYLEEDQSQDSRDRYGRILRYVWLQDGTNVNYQLVAEGYAFEYTYETPYNYQADFKTAQDEARIGQVGLWAASACNGEQKPVGTTGEPPVPTTVAQEGPSATALPTEQLPTIAAPIEQPMPTEQPAPTAAPAAPISTVRFTGCDTDPGAGSAPDAPVQIVAINKRAETVTLKNVSGEAIDIAGWTMCSIKGGQQHAISGVLAPGAQQVFENTGKQIWNNSERDAGALYDAEGHLVSYWGG